MTRLAAGISFVLLIATVGLVNTVLKHVEHAFAGQRILVEKSMSLAKDHLVSNFTASAYQAEGLTASLGEDLDSVLPVLKGGRSFKRTRGKLEPGTSRQFSDARQKIEFHWDKFRANYPECQSLTVIGADGQSIFTTSPFVMGGSLSAQWLKDFSESAADEGRSRYVVLDGEVRLLSIRPIFEDLAETPIAHLLVELAAPAIGKHGDFHISFVETEKLVSGAKLPDGVELNSLHSENAQVFGHEAVIASLPGVGLEVSRRPLLFEVVSADVVGLKFKVPNLDSAEIALWFSLVTIEQRILELQYSFFLALCILWFLIATAVFYLCIRVQRGVGNLCEVVVGRSQDLKISMGDVASQRVPGELVRLRNLITKLLQRLAEVDSGRTKPIPKAGGFGQTSAEGMVHLDGFLNSALEVVNDDDSEVNAPPMGEIHRGPSSPDG